MYKKFDFNDFQKRLIDVYFNQYNLPEYLKKWLVTQFTGHSPLSDVLHLNYERLTQKEHSFTQLSIQLDTEIINEFVEHLQQAFSSEYQFDSNLKDVYTCDLFLYNMYIIELVQLLHFYLPTIDRLTKLHATDYIINFLFQNDQTDVIRGRFVANNLIPMTNSTDYLQAINVNNKILSTNNGFALLKPETTKRFTVTNDSSFQLLDIFGTQNILNSYIPHYAQGTKIILYSEKPVLIFVFNPTASYVEAEFENKGHVLNMPYRIENNKLYIKTKQITEPILLLQEGEM